MNEFPKHWYIQFTNREFFKEFVSFHTKIGWWEYIEGGYSTSGLIWWGGELDAKYFNSGIRPRVKITEDEWRMFVAGTLSISSQPLLIF